MSPETAGPEGPGQQAFESASLAGWQDAVRAVLKGADPERAVSNLDGEVVARLGRETAAALDESARGLTAAAAAGRPITSCVAQRITFADLDRERITAELTGGVRAFEIACTSAESGQLSAHLDAAFPVDGESKDPGLSILLDCQAHTLLAGAGLIAHWQRRATPLDQVSACFGADPIGAALTGELPAAFDDLCEEALALAQWATAHAPRVTTYAVRGEHFHNAGGSAVQELAFAMASAVTYLEQLVASGMNMNSACQQITFTLAADVDLFQSIAKLRAARAMWHRIATASGATGDAAQLRLRVRVGSRSLSDLSPWVNLLRATVGAVAASAINADCILVPAFSSAPEHRELSQRLARNLQHMLIEESHLDTVIDPAGGAFAVEERTRDLASRAWEQFQDVQSRGGMTACVTSGRIASQIQQSAQERLHAARTREIPLVGVSDYVDLEFAPTTVVNPDSAVEIEDLQPAGSTIPTDGTASQRLEALIAACSEGHVAVPAAATGHSAPKCIIRPVRLDQPFVHLRQRTAELSTPTVALVQLGTAKENAARSAFARRAFAAGGFKTTPLACATPAELPAQLPGSPVVCICGTDSAYQEHVAGLAPALRAAGAKWVVLAGKPEALTGTDASAVDDFVHLGRDICDCLERACAALE